MKHETLIETLLAKKEDFYSHLNVKDITKDINDYKKSL